MKDTTKPKVLEYIITGDMMHIMPIKHVCDHPKLTSQRIVINRISNQAMNLPKGHPTYGTDLEAMIAIRKQLRDEVRYLNGVIKNTRRRRK